MDSFALDIKVINGEVQTFPVRFYFKCSELVAVGPDTLRYFNDDMCSVAMRVFYLRYNGELFGSTQFGTMAQFTQYMNAMCNPSRTYLLINGCRMVINGQSISI